MEDINMELKTTLSSDSMQGGRHKNIDLAAEFYFIGKTDEELSLVCRTEDTL